MDPQLLALAPTAIENVYHVGHLVPDLLGAMDALSRRLQLTWATPFEMDSGFETPDGGVDSDPVRIAFSVQGPPFLELIEVVPRAGSIFAEPAGGGLHHIGYYAERWRDEVARLTADGMELERTGAGVAFVRDPDLGIRFEIVSFRGRDFLTRILSGELGAESPLRPRS
jgi:catechol 2,3-dioxygenase-like lactoylglutathione lyase family enzyme